MPKIGTRFKIVEPMSPERRNKIVALNNISAQTPLIELMHRNMVRIWTMYDAEVEHGTFTDVYNNGLVVTRTLYRGGHVELKINRVEKGDVNAIEKATRKLRAGRGSAVPNVNPQQQYAHRSVSPIDKGVASKSTSSVTSPKGKRRSGRSKGNGIA